MDSLNCREVADGDQLDIDEWIDIDPGRLAPSPAGGIELPLVAMLHPQDGAVRFCDVRNASVVVENSVGRELLRAGLSSQFGEFVCVQMGSIMIDAAGANFVAVGVGFNGDFNNVLAHFS